MPTTAADPEPDEFIQSIAVDDDDAADNDDADVDDDAAEPCRRRPYHDVCDVGAK